ncbi:hypothetical protein LTR36_003194 [Oleoguttula mirabilis]|uniref:Alpha/beta-hydrolase n=1 Tax=Oleoguttula mirabilis TaxID=1507867 RepID=A0AAV9JXE3_9PEZI|nr:hypothetical protein LTR36_003194 [Oleoguttula mirabilis]
MVRDFFYIGGEYVYEPAFSSSIYSDQMYVEKLVRASGANETNPIVLINAGVPSGAAWLNTPDNRKGWASYFVQKGYIVYIVDTTSVGRSSQEQIAIYLMKIASTVKITENDYTAPQLIDPYPQSVNHTQWPGNGTQGDAYFDAFMAAMIPLTSNATSQELSMRSAGCTLLSMIGVESYLISHSAGATYPMLMSDQCPDLIKGNINLEPGNTPFQNLVGNTTVPAVGYSAARACGLTATLIEYSPAVTNCSQLEIVVVGTDTPGNRSCYMQTSPAHQLPNIAKVPYVAITGAASPHATYDHCTIAYLNQAGVSTDWIKLADIGIEGNGHFLYLEKNNLEIAGVVEQWIKEN